MKNKLSGIVAAISIGLISLPISFGLTIVLLPLWRWIESTFEIESVGHSGPAVWCYLVCYGIIFICSYFIRITVIHRHGKSQDN
jgi:hypothetical protein